MEDSTISSQADTGKGEDEERGREREIYNEAIETETDNLAETATEIETGSWLRQRQRAHANAAAEQAISTWQ